MKLFFLLTSTILLFPIHADGIAEYYYYKKQNHIILKFEMDKNELAHYRNNMDCSKNTMPNLCTSNYLLSLTQFKINGNIVDFEFDNSSIYNDHVILIFQSKNTYGDVKDVEIENNCFFTLNSKFKNRIRIDIDSYQKSYLLTKGKSQITL